MTDKELLAVLDMSEDEQKAKIAQYVSISPFKHDWSFSNAVGGSDNIATGEAWVCRKCGHEEIYKRTKSGQFIPAVLDKQSPECGLPDLLQESLADLAFRLRDEAIKENTRPFHDAIYKIMIKVEGDDKWATAFWGECIAKPIHWIIAALIAKDKDNG